MIHNHEVTSSILVLATKNTCKTPAYGGCFFWRGGWRFHLYPPKFPIFTGMNFDIHVFGEGFHRFVQQEMDWFTVPLGLLFHVLAFLVLILVFIYGNKVRKLFTVYFTINWLFLFGYWGVYAIVYWARIGPVYLATFVMTPILLGFIAAEWIRECVRPRIDIDLRNIPAWRYWVLVIVVWGLWYPTYLYGEGFVFQARDLLFSNFGLMPCPTTMVVLGLFTLKYPAGNRRLFVLLTMFSLIVGIPTVATGWIPDIPLIMIGVYGGIMLVFLRRQKRKSQI